MATRVVGATGTGSWWLFASALVLFSRSTWHWAAFHASVSMASPAALSGRGLGPDAGRRKNHFRFQFRAGFGDVCAKTREAAQGLIASDGQFVLLLHRDFGGIEDVSKVGVKVLVDVGDHVSTARHPC
jgi:hypothetical protein